MSKTAYILVYMLCSILSYGQQITFHENSNYRANILQQKLSEDQRFLLLESKTEEIQKVAIFNEHFSKNIEVCSYKTEIDLNVLPSGNFIIQAKLNQKWIIMYLEKKDDLKVATIEGNEHNVVSNKELNIDHGEISTTIDGTTITENNDAFFYWVVEVSNSSFGSIKSMRLEYKEDIDKLISKNKLELKSSIGKYNSLVIYEIYNKSEFMDNQLRNPAYYQTAEASKFLNTEPHYASNNE